MNDFQMGRHEEAIRHLQDDVTELRTDTRKILSLLAEKRGERKMVAKIGVAVGAMVGSATTVLLKLLMMKFGVHT